MGTHLNALPALPVRAWTVPGCLNSTFWDWNETAPQW